MRDRQAELLEALKAAAAVLERNGIPYFSAYGTSIGAVRHNGFIPWDDDIDLFLFREDLDAVRGAMERELDPSQYYFHDPSTDLTPHIVSKGDDFVGALERQEAAFIDLFLLHRHPTGLFRRLLATPVIWTMIVASVVSSRVRSEPVNRAVETVIRVSERLLRSLPEPDSDRLVVYTTGYLHSIYPRSDFDGEVRMPFEDTELPLPSGYDRMLRAQYGDYMTPPPDGGRTGAKGFPVGVLRDYLRHEGRARP